MRLHQGCHGVDVSVSCSSVQSVQRTILQLVYLCSASPRAQYTSGAIGYGQAATQSYLRAEAASRLQTQPKPNCCLVATKPEYSRIQLTLEHKLTSKLTVTVFCYGEAFAFALEVGSSHNAQGCCLLDVESECEQNMGALLAGELNSLKVPWRRGRKRKREIERDSWTNPKAGHLINRRVVGRAKCLRVVATTPMPGRKKRDRE